MRKNFWRVAAVLGLVFSAAAFGYEKRINCGSDQAVAGPLEMTFDPDVAYDATNGAGYVCDGCGFRNIDRPLSRWRGHADPYNSTLDGPGPIEYRFDLSNGNYLITAAFVHYCYYWEQDPCFNEFDILVEGQPAVAALNIEKEAQGHWKVLEYRIRATVTDGQLNFALQPLAGHATIAAIEVTNRPNLPGAPAVPQGLRAQDGYGRVDLLWTPGAEADLAGYRIYRAVSAEGPWERIDDRRENLQAVYNDWTAPEGSPWFYRITAVDIEGNESAPSAAVTGFSRGPWESTLPLVSIELTEENLALLNQTYWTDVYYPGTVDYPGLGPVTADIRYRGNIARWFSKRGWKVKLDAQKPDWGGDTLNLNSDMWDAFMVRKCLSFDLYRQRGVVAPECQPVHVRVNGEFYGVAQEFENGDEAFLEHHGLDPQTELFKSDSGGLFLAANPAEYRTQYLQETGTAAGYLELQKSIEAINAATEDIPNVIAENFDLPDFVQFYAAMNFLAEWDSCIHNFNIFRDPRQGLWRFVPLDHDGSWGNSPWDPYSVSTSANIGICTEQQQAVGWNKLYDLYIRNLQLRKRHANLLREMTAPGGPWSNQVLDPLIDAAVGRILTDGMRDANKLPWEDNGPLSAAAASLRWYVGDRAAWIATWLDLQYNSFREPSSEFNLYINEFMARNVSAVQDEFGEYDEWIEIHNAANYPVDLGGVFLSDDANTPKKWSFPAGTTLPALGFLVVWADNQPSQGPLHAPLTLNPANGSILLTSRGGLQIQRARFRNQTANISQGMLQDGFYRWRRFLASSPGAPNSAGVVNQPALITETHHTPPYPGPETAPWIIARIEDDRPISAPKVKYQQYSSGGGTVWATVVMFDDGLHNDGPAGDSVYGAQLPAQNYPGSPVGYYVTVTDSVGVVSTDPPGAPDRTYRYVIGGAPPAIQINEFMADNASTIGDERGEFEDWVELRNLGGGDIDLAGLYLSDDPQVNNRWRFPDGTILPAGGYLLVWCDSDTSQGPLHATFKLSKGGEGVFLFDRDETGRVLIDGYSFGPQKTDWSEGRWPEGAGTWVKFFNSTPNQPNQEPDGPPEISGTARNPQNPTQGQAVTVTATVTDDHALVRVELFVDSGSGFAPQPMFDDGVHGDGAAGDHLYGSLIPPQGLGGAVRYFVEAEDNLGRVARDPASAPADSYGYTTAYQPPPLFINEFLADNKKTNRDEAGDYEDWIEIFNAGAADADLSGMSMTDDLANSGKWRFPAGTILKAREFLLVWADEEAAEGPLHASFKLSKSGEQIGLFDTDANGRNLVDSFVFGAQTTDRSQGRQSDGGPAWVFFTSPTPGDTNNGVAAVTGVVARPFNTVVDLTWKPHPDPLVTGYDVLGADTAGGPFTRLNSQPVRGMLQFRDLGRVNGQPRYYKVRALLSDGRRSRDHSPVAATPQGGQTTPVTDLGVARDGTDIVLSWTEPTNDPPLLTVEISRDTLPLLDAEVDQGLHLYGQHSSPGRFLDPGEALAPATRFYVVRPVDLNGQRATE